MGVSVLRKVSYLAAVLLAMGLWTPGYGQDPPSLGEIARQTRKDKEKSKAPAKTVVTDEDLPSSKSAGGLGNLADAKRLVNPDAGSPASADLDRAEEALSRLDSMDRVALAKFILEGSDVDFPNRRAWEDKMFEAKQVYIVRSRALIQEMKRILASAQSLRASQSGQGNLSANDPRMQELVRRIKLIAQEASRTDATFQAILLGGRDLAKQAISH
jgi:hypothetical protein